MKTSSAPFAQVAKTVERHPTPEPGAKIIIPVDPFTTPKGTANILLLMSDSKEWMLGIGKVTDDHRFAPTQRLVYVRPPR